MQDIVVFYGSRYCICENGNIDEAMEWAIKQGFVENAIDFIEGIDEFQFYRIGDNQLKISGIMRKPAFIIEG